MSTIKLETKPILYNCTVHLGNVSSQISGDIPVDFWNELSLRMSYEIPGAYFSAQFQNKYWDGRKKLFNKRSLSFPTGLFSLFRKTCDDFQVGYTVVDARGRPALGKRINIKGIKLRDYQLEAVDVALQKQRGMIRAATGSGKTEMIAELIGRTNVNTLILIHKQDIFHQLVERLTKRLGITIGEIGCGKVMPQKITVGMIQTIHKAYGYNLRGLKGVEKDKTVISKPEIIKLYVESCDAIIVDECHHVAASIFGKVLTKCEKAFYRWGFSASPFREDNADLLLDAHTGARCVDISASELIGRGYLSQPTIYLLSYDHKRPTGFGYQHMYEQQVVKNTLRNKLVVQSVLRAIVAKKTSLIAVTRIEHGEALTAMLRYAVPGKIKFASGKLSADERKKILKDLNDRKIDAVVATTVFGEGIDCPTLDVLVNAKANQSSIDSLQLVGRALRKTANKDKVTIIDIYDDHCKYLGKHAKARYRIYKSEPLFKIRRIKSPLEIVFP